jgi:CRP-like cAMP-binding protein
MRMDYDQSGPSRVPNAILTSLASPDSSLLTPHLQPVKLKLRRQLEAANRKIDSLYFIESGLASAVATNGSRPSEAEVCIIGREGVTGVAVLLGMERSITSTFVQVEGEAKCISSDELVRAMAKSASLAQILLRYVHLYIVQVEQTALANARAKVDQRLARWLLMARDRLESTEIRLTHEFLSIMLGVRRAGVTTALNELESRGLITAARCLIRITDCDGLREAAGGFYGSS